jgi:hypothetical protein
VADTSTFAEARVHNRRAFGACAGINDHIWKCRQAIQDSRELMAKIDKVLGCYWSEGKNGLGTDAVSKRTV